MDDGLLCVCRCRPTKFWSGVWRWPRGDGLVRVMLLAFNNFGGCRFDRAVDRITSNRLDPSCKDLLADAFESIVSIGLNTRAANQSRPDYAERSSGEIILPADLFLELRRDAGGHLPPPTLSNPCLSKQVNYCPQCFHFHPMLPIPPNAPRYSWGRD